MAHLWILNEGQWAVFPMSIPCYDLTTLPPKVFDDSAPPPIELMLVDREWVLLTEPHADVRVNGLPVAASIHLLADRDEIKVRAERLYFSTEMLASVEEYTAGAIRCPRCKLEISAGAVVRCPGCKAVHHEECWGYAPHCSLCPTPTPLDAGYQWTPEEL